MSAKIIATIGPASLSFNVLKRMKDNGVNIVRINTKYGDTKEWGSILSNARKLGLEVMVDIKGFSAIHWINLNIVDYVAVSFAISVKQIRHIRELLVDKEIKIISKIESKRGLKNSNNLIKESDGLMIARGDLSKNVSYENVPIYKRQLLKECKFQKKFVIVATEMLLSMVKSKKPTNAEADDIFDAVVSGANAIMLSEETAIGKHPAMAVKVMNKIKNNALKYLDSQEKIGDRLVLE